MYRRAPAVARLYASGRPARRAALLAAGSLREGRYAWCHENPRPAEGRVGDGEFGSVVRFLPGVVVSKRMLSRVLLLGGAAATLLAALLPWVTVNGPSLSLDLGLVGARAQAGDRTVAGLDTSLWPVLTGVAAIVAALALLGIARRVLLVLGLLVTAAGALLLVYMANVIEIETKDSGELERAAADALLTSSIGPGTPVLLAGGIAIVAGALLARG